VAKRKIWAAISLIVVVALGWVAYTYTKGAETKAATKVTLAQVGEFFIYMPLYIAQGKGFFRDEGLDVTIVNTGGDEKSVAAVISGSADFGVGDPTFAAIAGLQGQDVKVVASVVNGVPFWGVTKNPRVPAITSPSLLSGFSVATFPSPSTAFTLQTQMFRTGGLEPNIRQAQFGTLLPLLDTGTVDIVLELEPNVSTAVAQGARVVYSMAETYGDFAITGVTVTQKTITNRRSVVEQFVRALDRAEKFGHANLDDAIVIAKSRFPSIAPAVVEQAMRRMLAGRTYPTSAAISVDAWKNAIKLRVHAGEIPIVESAMRFLDNSFASQLKQ
jgi:NitT/TauT family transport system substrate-binding protein